MINNTTNINIINYNCYNNSTNRSPNIQIQKKILDIAQNSKNQIKSIINQNIIENNSVNLNKSKEINNNMNNNNNLTLINGNESFYPNKKKIMMKKKSNNFAKSMINFNTIKVHKNSLDNKYSKKLPPVNKIENDQNNNSNIDISKKIYPIYSTISLSQGKLEKNKNNKEQEKDKDKGIIKQENNTNN